MDTPIKTAVLTTDNFEQLKTRLTWNIQANNWPNPQQVPGQTGIQSKGKGAPVWRQRSARGKPGRPGGPVRPAGRASGVRRIPVEEGRRAPAGRAVRRTAPAA